MARVDVGAPARGVERTVRFCALGLTSSFAAGRAKEARACYKSPPICGPKRSTTTMREYVPAILRLLGWAAYVAGVFSLTRVAAKRLCLTTGGKKMALYAISVGGVMLNLAVYKTAAGLLPQPFDLALIAAVGFGAIAMFFAILTA
jgi:hypothetical protein